MRVDPFDAERLKPRVDSLVNGQTGRRGPPRFLAQRGYGMISARSTAATHADADSTGRAVAARRPPLGLAAPPRQILSAEDQHIGPRPAPGEGTARLE